jgi:AraC family transcriptional regulator, transcriptional activator FtrA
MTIYVNIMPKLTGPLVAALIYDGLCTFEFGLVAEIFGLSRPEMGDDWYRFATCPIEPGPLRAQGGLLVEADGDVRLLSKADIIVAPGWKGVDAPVPDALVQALCTAHARGARLVSICSGAFVLAATGLLDGATATTHWRYANAMRRRFPAVSVDETSLYRSHGTLFTSAGSAAGIDLLIEIVRQDYGPEAANSVARRMVIPAHRTGGQAQFLEQPVRLREGTEIAPFLDTVRTRLSEPWTISRMASEVAMSERTFLRRFFEATGGAPGEWVTGERLELAKTLLCKGDQSVEDIAAAAGMGSAQVMRHHFRQRLGISPMEYRSRFRNAP